MKNFFIFFILILSINISAQGSGGQRMQGGQGRQNLELEEAKKFSASDATGIFYYNIEEVIKKIKVKDDKKLNLISNALKEYNLKIKEIAFSNSAKFKELDIIINALPKRTRQSRNQSSENNSEKNNGIRRKIGEIIRPVKDKILVYEKELNLVFEKNLSSKQQKKWIKYQKKKKDSLKPKKPQNRQNQNSRSNGSRGQGNRRQ